MDKTKHCQIKYVQGNNETCMKINDPLFRNVDCLDEMAKRKFHNRLQSNEELPSLSDEGAFNLVLLDDLLDSVTTSSDMENLFVKGMHHRHLSVLYLNLNLYCRGKYSRTINLVTQILVLMKNPRDVSQLQCLARQAFLGFYNGSFQRRTSEPYGYLVLDFSPSGDELHSQN